MTDDITVVDPLQLVKGDDGKVIVPAVTAKIPAIMPDGRPCWVYPDGAVRGDKGRLMALPAYDGLALITSDNSREMTKQRQARGVELALQGMQMAADDLNITIDQPDELWAHIIRSQAVQAIRKRATDAARLVGQATKQMPDRAAADAEQPAAGHSVDVDALIRLAQAMDREVERRVADAVAVDGEIIE